MILQIPVTRMYEVHIDSEDGQPTRPSARQAKEQASQWSIERIEAEGNLVQVRSGHAQVICLDYADDMPCTD